MKHQIAKVFRTGRSQAVRIPKAYRFNCEEVLIERDGNRIVLTPRPISFKDYFAHALRFTDDFPDQIDDKPPERRRPL